MNRSKMRPESLAFVVVALFAALSCCNIVHAGNPTVYSFGTQSTDGTTPESPLTLDSYGNLWGTTEVGGANGNGTVFEIMKGTTTPILVHAFAAKNQDGALARGGMVLVGSTLYGVTFNGGHNADGSLYSIVPNGAGIPGGNYTVVFRMFYEDGFFNPVGTPCIGPTGDTNHLYFCTEGGGTNGDGAIVQFDLSNDTIENSYSFNQPTYNDYGTTPYGTLVLGRSSSPYYIYGETYSDTLSAKGNGEIFKIQVPSLAPTTLTVCPISSLYANQGHPFGGLIQGLGADTNLYGTLSDDINKFQNQGNVFKIATTLLVSSRATLYTFTGVPVPTDGDSPYAQLAWDATGTYLYGTTSGQLVNDAGTIFRVLPNTSNQTNTTLYNFNGSLTTAGNADGSQCFANLLYDSNDGFWYGATAYGGLDANGGTTEGAIFRFGPPTTYQKSYFTSVSTAIPVSLAWSDLTWATVAGITENGYSINGGVAATPHGTISTPLSSGTTTPTSPLARTYTPTAGYVGTDSFNYTMSNSAFGSSVGTNGTTTIYIGALTPAATPNPVTATTTTLSVGGDFTSDTTLTYTWSTTGTPPAPVTFSGSTNGTNAAKAGVIATFTMAGTYNFQCLVTTPDGTTDTLTLVVTVNQTASGYTIAPSPATVEIGDSITFVGGQVDQFGNSIAGSAVYSKVSGLGTINAATGVYTANATTPGTAKVKATTGAFSATSTITITSTAPTVAQPAEADGNVGSETITASSAALSALGSYPFPNAGAGQAKLTYTWSYTTTGSGAVTYSPTGATGNGSNAAGTPGITATFTAIGTYVFTVTIANPAGTSVTSSVTVVVSPVIGSITVTPTGTTGARFQIPYGTTQQFAVTALDQFGAPYASPTVTWVANNNSVSGTGLYTASPNTGNDYVEADSTNSAAFGRSYIRVTNPAPTVATAATINGNTSTATIYTTSGNLAVLGSWAAAESYLTYTWTDNPVNGNSNSGNETFSPNGTNPSKNSVVTFPAAGEYQIFANIATPDNNSVTSPAASPYLDVFVVSTPTTLNVTPTTASVPLGGTFKPTIQTLDQWGVAMTGVTSATIVSGPGTVNNTNGKFTAPSFYSPLPATTVVDVIASNAGNTITVPVTITITDVAPTIAQAAAASPNPVTTASTNLSVLGAYVGGESNLTYTWSSTGPAAVTYTGATNGTHAASGIVANFTRQGTYVFTATVATPTGLTATSSVTVNVIQTATTFVVTPNPASCNISSTLQFAATEVDQFGVAMPSQPTITWTEVGAPGSIDSTGLFSATGSSGSGTVYATSGTVQGSSNLTVNDVAPVITGLTATPNPVSGTTTALKATATYAGGISKLTYTWSATGPFAVSSFTPNGTTAAKNSTATFAAAGLYTVTVTVTTPTNIQVTQHINVTVTQTATSVSVTPNPGSVGIGNTLQLTANELDQFGANLTTQPTFTWAMVSGVGSVNSSGLFNAGATLGTGVVKATAGALSGQTTINVVNSPPTVATPAAASPNPVTSGTTTNLSVLGAYAGGESALTYTWSATGPGTVTYSANGTNAAKNSVATFSQSGVYYFTVVINDGAGGSTSSTVTVTVKQKATAVVVTPSAFTLKIGDTYNFNAVVNDQFGQPFVPQPTITWSISAGLGSIDPVTGIYSAPLTTTVATIVATAGSISGTATATVIDVAPTFNQDPSATPNPVLLTTTDLSVLGAYLAGESNLTYTWSVTGPAAVTYSDNGDNTAKNCVATFTKVGTYVFTATLATPSGKTAAETVTVNVLANPTAVTVTPNPANVSINGAQAFSASVTDQFNSPIASPPVTWSVSSGTAGAINGSGSYTAGTTPGTYSVIASCTLNTQTASGTATVNVADIAPTVGAITVNPNPVTASSTTLTVTGSYAGGGTLTYTWSATSGPAPVSFSGGTSGTAGSAVSTTATFAAAGTYTVKVVVTDTFGTSVTQTVTFNVVQTASSLVVSPATPTVAITSAQQFTAVVLDQFSNPLATQPTFAWTVVGTGTINSSGLYTAPIAPGTDTVQAAASGLTGTSTVTIIDSPPTVATAATATPNPVTATTTALSVLGAWAGGEPNLTYTWAATGPAAVTFSANGTNAAKSSVATFTSSGAYVFTVTITNSYSNSTTSTVSVTVSQTITTIAVTPNPAAVAILGTVSFNALAYDQFGNALNIQPAFNWVVGTGTPGTVDAYGNFTAGAAAGSGTVKAGAGGKIGAATVFITNVPPTITAAAAANPNPVAATSTTLTVGASWIGGASNLIYTWSQTAGPVAATFDANNGTIAGSTCVATFTQAGAYTFMCTVLDSNGGSTTSSVNVIVNQTPTTTVVNPHTASTVIGATVQILAGCNDQFGNPISPIPFLTWTVSSGGGSVSNSGLYTAPGTVGTATVSASAVGATSDSCVITINDVAPTVATPAAATPNPVTATTTALSVLGAYPGGESTLTYTWSATGPAAVTYSANGTNAAKASTATFTKAGSYVFTVTIKNASGLSTTSQVTVTVNQTATGVVVTPSTLSIATTDTYTFTASATDQFGNAMATQPTFTWSLTTTDGSTINSGTGIFTAGATTERRPSRPPPPAGRSAPPPSRSSRAPRTSSTDRSPTPARCRST